jgi:hypothetical protein
VVFDITGFYARWPLDFKRAMLAGQLPVANISA